MCLFAVELYNLVTVLKTDLLCCLAELESVVHLVQVNIVFTPCEKYHRVDEYGKDKVEHYTTDYDEQSLPCRF